MRFWSPKFLVLSVLHTALNRTAGGEDVESRAQSYTVRILD